MVELRWKDEAAFIKFMGMLPEIFDERLHRMSQSNAKQHTLHARQTAEERIALYMDGGRTAEGRRGRWQNGRKTL